MQIDAANQQIPKIITDTVRGSLDPAPKPGQPLSDRQLASVVSGLREVYAKLGSDDDRRDFLEHVRGALSANLVAGRPSAPDGGPEPDKEPQFGRDAFGAWLGGAEREIDARMMASGPRPAPSPRDALAPPK